MVKCECGADYKSDEVLQGHLDAMRESFGPDMTEKMTNDGKAKPPVVHG